MTSGKVPAKAFAVFAVALMLSSSIVFLSTSFGENSQDTPITNDPNQIEVVYHPYYGEKAPTTSTYNGSTAKVFPTKYFGTVTTEYNPQMWDVADKWYSITNNGYSSSGVGYTLVFTGWVYESEIQEGVDYNNTGTTHYNLPGDVVDPVDTDGNGKIDIYATWGKMTGFASTRTDDRAGITEEYNLWGYYDGYFSKGNLFTNFIKVDGEFRDPYVSLDNGWNPIDTRLRIENCTILSEDFSNPTRIDATGDGISLGGDVIIDHLRISGISAGGSGHGKQEGGIYANGHHLVIGPNVSMSGSSVQNYPQVFGGSDTGTSSDTKLIVHGGTYSNLVAGSREGSVIGNTFLVIRGDTTVLDSVVGGCSGENRGENAQKVTGSTYVYVVGKARLVADSYQETKMGTDYIPSDLTVTESSILTGGSNYGRIGGSSNVFISDQAVLWDVQGGGRRGDTYVQDANVVVSGKATIRHVLCGSITDGLDGSKDNGSPSDMGSYDGSVKNVNITVKDAAAVGSVFGAGYDTYYNTLYASMFNGGSISIDIQGGTVGYVYGGGYRGAIGYSGQLTGTSYSSRPLNSISINISGGTVLEDVFGGGRGGVDKVLHRNDDGDLGENGSGSPGKNDSTGFAWVSVRDLSITVSGDAVVRGSVYGGGESAPVLNSHNNNNNKRPAVAFMDADSISVEVSGSAQVQGSVFGAGKGVDISTYTTNTMILKSNNSTTMDRILWYKESDKIKIDDKYDAKTNYNAAGYAAVGQGRNTPNDRPDIALSIIGEANVGDGQSAVFGAGRLAYTYADSIEIHLGNGGLSGPELKGDVFGGGLGTSGEFSVESSRTIVLNSATVNGNIYGGSRNGNDGNVSAEVSQISKTAEIDLISGTVKQNVFGGGFQGKSMYDAVIRFGTPAVDEIRPTSVQNTDLRVTSIYGGGYFDPDSGAQVQDLVMGDATIHIGSSALSGAYSFPGYANIGDAGSGSRISISGNVFGDGSYSTVKGTTTVEFDGYTQTSGTASQRMMSVQLVDVLRFISSEVDLSGSSQGGTGTLSQKMSLNSVGSLNLHASSSIRLYAETSAIGGLNSYESEDESSLFLPEGYYGSKGNSISLLGGAPGTILGANNMGTDSKSPGIINGFTELDNGGDVYYGAFILGSRQTYDNTGGFVVKDEEGNYGLASVLNYNQYIKVWFIAGASSIERVLTFSADENGSYLGSGDDDSVTFPKIAEDSKLYYTGAYIDYESQNSMYVAEKGTSGSEKVVFNMGLSPIDSSGKSVSVSTHTYNGSSWVLQTSSSNSEIDRQIVLRSNLDNDWLNKDGTPASYGLLGYVVVQVIEAYSYGTAAGSIQVPIHTIDLIVGMYIEPVDGAGDFNVTLVDTDNGLYTGSVYIPLSWKGVVTNYTFSGFSYSGFSDGNNQFTLSAGTLMGMDGWIQTDYRDGYTVDPEKNVSFGSGGVVQPVLVLDYLGPGLANGKDSGTLTFKVELTYENGVSAGDYTITVTFSTAEPVHVYLQYSQLSDNGVTYVLSSETDEGRTVLKWVVKTDDAGYGVELPFNTAITEHTFKEDVYIDGEPYGNLVDVLDAIIKSIKVTDIDGFVYKDHFAGWFSDPEMIRMYNMGSDVSQDIVLYAKFGIKVTFDYGNNTPAYQTFIGYNTSLHDNGIYNYDEFGETIGDVEVTSDKIPGYAYFHGDSDYTGHYIKKDLWVIDKDSLETISFDVELKTDTELHIVWEVETYHVEIEITFEGTAGPDEDWFDLSGQADGGTYNWDQSEGTLSFKADYNSTVTFTIADRMHIGRGTTGIYGNGQQLPFIGDSSSTQFLSFRVPDAGDDVSKENPGKIVIRITVTDLFDVTVDLIYVDEFTSKLQPEDSLTATPVNGSGTNLNAVTISGSSLDPTGGKTIILQKLPVNTLIDLTTVIHEGAGYGYTMSVWVNGVLVDDDFELKVSGNNIDPVVTVALHRTVDILNDPSWNSCFISGIAVYRVVVPSSLDGEWGYGYGSVWVSADDIQNVYNGSYQIRENDAFVIAPVNGYTIYDDPEKGQYCPANTVRVVHEDVLYFSVTGTGDITLDTLTKIEQALNVYFEFIGPDKQQYTGSVDAIESWSIQLVFGGQTYYITVGEASNNTALVVPYTIGQPVQYTASLEGFDDTKDWFNGIEDEITVQLILIGYTILFHDLDNNIKEVGWTVFDGPDVPAPSNFKTAVDSAGEQVYVRIGSDGTGLSFVRSITTTLFDSTHRVDISALAQPEGSTEGVMTSGMSILIAASTVQRGSTDIGKDLFGGEDVTFTFGGGVVEYDADTGILSFQNARLPASGTVTLVSDGHKLTITVIADAEAIV